MRTLINVGRGVCLFLGIVCLAAIIISLVKQEYNGFWSGIIFTIFIWVGYFALGYFFPKEQNYYGGGTIGANPNWKCPNCSAVLMKKLEDQDLLNMLGSANVAGSVTCGQCNMAYSHSDVYGGKYDA